MTERGGEKLGWTGGWLGGFLWVAALAGVFLCQGKRVEGIAGLALLGAAVAGIVSCAPWRHPTTPYWKLMLAPYGLFVASAAWGIWSFGGVGAAGLNWWFFLWFFPLLIPFGSLSHRRWADGDARREEGRPR